MDVDLLKPNIFVTSEYVMHRTVTSLLQLLFESLFTPTFPVWNAVVAIM